MGGFLALAGAIVVGPRKGFREGEDLKGHNMPYVVIGTFILFFGWFGFNINSDTLGLNAVNTLLAGRGRRGIGDLHRHDPDGARRTSRWGRTALWRVSSE